jgi:hypothetical protein
MKQPGRFKLSGRHGDFEPPYPPHALSYAYGRTQRIVDSLRLEILSGGDSQNLRVRRVFEAPNTIYRIELENPEMNYQRTTLLDGDALEELLQTDGVRDRLENTLSS